MCVILAVAAALAAAGARAQSDGVIRRLAWQVETSDPVPRHWPLTYGETVDMEPTFLSYRRPMQLEGASVVLHARTNGMAEGLSFQATGAVANAAGTVRVRVAVDALLPQGLREAEYTLAVTAAGTTNLLAARGTLRLSGSGAGIAAAPLPAPEAAQLWQALAAASAEQAETNALFAAWLDGITSGTNSWWQAAAWGNHAAAGYAGTGSVASVAAALDVLSNAVANLPPPSAIYGTNQWIDGDGGVWKWVITTNIVVTFSTDFATEDGHKPPQLSYPFPFVDAGFDCAPRDDYIALMYSAGEYEAQWANNNSLTIPARLDPIYNAVGYAMVDYQFAATRVDAVAINSDLSDATNSIVQTYLLGTDAWMTVSNQTLTVWRVADGVTNAHVIGGGGTSIDPSATNALWLALNNGLAQKAPKAWGTLAPDGSPNPDPEFMTFLNAPVIMHASGFQWATSGGHAVLAESGAVAFQCAGETGGELRIGPDVCSNYFGFVRGDSLTIGATPLGIDATNAGGEDGVVQIVYPYGGGDFPVIWFSPSLSTPFTVTEGVLWVDQENGFAIVTAPATTASGFWYATTTLSVSAYFVSTMPAKFTGGVIGGTNAAPVIYDSTITVTSGGKSYRIPAQEVE
jgi:hypothetical protein